MGAYMIRAGRGGVYAADWLERGVIGIGWDFGGANIAAMDRNAIKTAYAAAHPSESERKVAATAGQVYRFAHSMVQDSTIVMYDPAERLYHIGTINGPCEPIAEPEATTHTRSVKWDKTAPRDALAPASKKARALSPRSNIARALWARPQSGRSLPDFARETAGSTFPQAASPRKPAMKPIAPTSPFA